jgi:uncharacterized damage-inducible protein DinB
VSTPTTLPIGPPTAAVDSRSRGSPEWGRGRRVAWQPILEAMPDLIADFYRQNEWANLTLIEYCKGLTDEQLDATAEGTFGSIRDTLRHIVAAECGYAVRLGATEVDRIPSDAPWPGLDELAERAKASATALTRLGHEASDEPITVGPPDDPWEVEPAVILTQMFHHSTEHRTQINTILTSLGLEALELSAWEWGVADGRMRSA